MRKNALAKLSEFTYAKHNIFCSMNDTHHQSTRFISIIFFAFFVLLALVGTTWIFFQYVSLQDSRPTSSVSVSGSAKEKVKYDTAKLTFYITKKGEDVAKLNTEVDESTTKIREILTSKNIPPSDIQDAKSSYPDYSFNPTTGNQTSQQTVVENRISITIQDVQNNLKLPNVLTEELTKNGVTRFDPYQYEFKDSKVVCERLKTTAIIDARTKGTSQIKALGGSTIVKTQLQDGNNCDNQFGGYPVPYFVDKAVAVTGGNVSQAPEVFTGQRELMQDVLVTFEYR
jgi:uncharacterized protein YggE